MPGLTGLIVLPSHAAEISFQGIYFPPFLLAMVLGFVGSLGLTKLLKGTGLGRYFWHPGLVFLAFWMLLSSLIGLTVLPP